MSKIFKNRPFHIGTARFNNDTYKENVTWKERKNWKGCCYGFDKNIAPHINKGDYIFVIEMNNSTNQIMGIGLIINAYNPNNRTRIYDQHYWNKYVYKSKYHISREKLLAEPKKKLALTFLEIFLFYGSRHFKRGQGCIIVPLDRIATYQHQITQTNKKSSQYCKKCGVLRKGHKCKGRIIKKHKHNLKCHLCHKPKKGHICKKLKKNLLLVKAITNFFLSLFQ